jgi:hypothetical protein
MLTNKNILKEGCQYFKRRVDISSFQFYFYIVGFYDFIKSKVGITWLLFEPLYRGEKRNRRIKLTGVI